MQCRICLDTDRVDTMVSPCNCRGTSAFIHRSCLEEYYIHYPDRICRVCHQKMMYSTEADVLLTQLFFVWGVSLIWFSASPFLSKLVYGLTLLCTMIFATSQKFLTASSIIFVMSIASMFLFMEYEATLASICFLIALGCIYTMGLYVSPQAMLVVISILLVGLYIGLFAVVVATHVDPYLTAFYVTFVFLIWSCVLHIRRPPLRFL
jgi:hypothetical protein